MPKPDFREQFKRALAKIKQLKSELEVAQAQAAQAPPLPSDAPVGGEPIAIVGMGCRFPGADSLEEFWSVLVEGQDRVVDIPDERVVHHWPAEVPRWAGLLDDVAGFDAEFFGISPREALKLDPQQRLALEVSWAALEHANLRPSALSGSNTGVFLGLCNVDYLDRVHATDFSGWEAYDLTGTISSTASGRIAYTLGLQGPTLTLDTACSSSLVAIHLAVNALRLGECDLALAGGSSVIASEGTQSGLYRTRALSADGRCKTFDASANGFVPGEGCGMLVLERLSDAQAKGHRVLAVVRGSAVNQDGRSTGLTAPNGLAQQSMLRAALRDAELEPDAISYIECHGTGTVLGDPIETDSLEAVFNDPKLRARRPAERPDRGPLWLGAVKTNIGHLVAAAGVAGVIKTVLALEHDALPPNLNLRHLNPRVRFEGSPLQPLRAQTPWAAEGPSQARYAGVSSFGMSGTNAHVIVGEAPEAPETKAPETKAPLGLVPVLVSGRSRAALVAQAEQLRASLGTRGELSPASQLRLAAALAHNRTHFEHRAALFADTPQALAEALGRLVEGVDERGAPAASVVDFPEADSLPSRPKLAFLFTGQGSQRLGMGRELAATFPRFAAALDELCAALDPHLPRPLKSVLFAEPDTPEAALLDETGFTQPALFAVEVALFRLLESWGLRPAYLLGHSIGELAAAHVSGVFDLAAASTLVAARARLMQALPKGGAMASVQASEAEVQAVLDDLIANQGEAVIAIAGLNGPMSTVVAGDEAPVLATMAAFEGQGRKVRRLQVSHAFHSPRMEPMLDAFRSVVAGLEAKAPRIPIVSNLSGAVAKADELRDPDYWVRHVRHAVRFLDGIRTLETLGVNTALELGPHGVLSSMAVACLDASAGSESGRTMQLHAMMRRRRPEAAHLVRSLAAAHCEGIPVDWGAFFGSWGLPSTGPVPERLPTYAFQRAPYWLSPTPALAPEQGKGAAPLGPEATATPSEQSLWAAVDAGDLAGLADLLELGDDDDARDALRRALPGLERWRRRARARAAVDAWSYAVDWRPVEAQAATTPATTPVLFASTRDREHPRVAALAEAFGASVEPLDLDALADAEGRAKLDERLAALDPDAPLLSLLALDETLDPARPGLPAGAALNVALIQGLARAPGETPLWLLTFGAVGDQPGRASAPLQRPLQAMTAGLGQAASLERPELVAGVIDLPAQADALADEAAALSPWLRGDETHLALRPEGAHARRLIPTAELSDGAAPLAELSELSELSGTALITGGTGGLGSALARELVRAGVDKLVLTSRRGPTAPGAEALRASLLALAEAHRARPLEVEIVACDITDAEATRAVLATIDAGDSPLRAVIHTAGIAGAFEPLDSLELDALAPVTGAKVEGARILDALLDERGPDRQPELFVLISSIAATWGSGQQLAYSAANAYLDALSQARRARGQAAFAVAWGPMGGGGADEGVGMATGDALVHLERRGLRPVPMATVAQLTLLTAHQTRAESGAGWLGERSGLTLVDVDWRRFYPSYTLARPRPLLAAVEPEAEPSEGPDQTASEPAFVAELRGLVAEAEGTLDAEAPRRAVLGLVLQTTRQILGFAPDHTLDARRGFADLGLDSLMAVDMRTALNKATGLSLPATLTFDHPTPERVTALLLDAFREVLEPAPQAQLSRAPESAPPVEVRQVVDAGQPIAIVGVGLRLPGGVTSLDELWALLDEGRDVLVPVPKSRWDNDAIYDPDSEAPGKTYVRHGAFLDQPIEDFDPAFFNISPREAAAIDPQHRLLMEAAWEALERAGVVPGELLDSLSGTFIGVGQSDYAQQLHRNPAADAYAVMGTHASFASGRLSFTLGLQGPAVAVDTACSSSLVALHMAAKALRNGECDLALTGGAQVLLSPDSYISLSRMRAVAPDGRCKTFSANADGYGRGEGVVVLALERLDDALAKGREILALVRGTAVNHDGASSGITAPNGTSQQKVLRAALADAELEPRDIDYVECHGTGTRLGDPIEVQALGAVFGRDREPERPLLIGAIKSTLGHLETAAGVAGIAKVLAALRHRRLPANAHSQPPNPHIEWDALPVEVVAEGRAWTDRSGAGEQPLRAGVSSFGLSGTNAHIILEQAPAPATTDPQAAAGPLLLPLSARSPEALRAHAERLAAHLRGLEAGAAFEPAELAWTLATKRSHFEHRAAVVVPAQASPAAIAERLDPVAADAPAATHVRAEARAEGKVCFVFPGQGSQWPAMARELLEQSPEFRASVEACAQALAPHVDWDLLAVLEQREGAADLTRVDVVQPVLFAVMVSLAAVWRSCGVTPDLVIGHSQGEIAAAHVAGILSLDDAAKVVALRSRVITQLAGTGAMAATALDADSLREVLEAEAYRGRVALGVDNGPASTVASGDPEAIDALVEDLNARGVFARRVKVDYASHCHHVAGIESDLLDALDGLEPREAAIPMLSTVDPDEALDGRRLDGRYWYENLRQTVRFAEAVDRACAHGHRFFVEISPHPVMPVALDGLVRAIGVEAAVLPSLRRDEGSLERLLASVGALHCHGHHLDWAAALGRDPEAPASPAVALPTYPFQRARHWIEAQSETADLSSAGLQSLEHPILRAYFTVAGEPVKRVASTSLAEDSLGWLADHRVHGRTVFPGAGLVDLGLSAALELWPQASGLRLDELLFAAPLILDADPLELQVVLEGDDPRRRLLSVHTRRVRSRTQGAGLPADELDAGWVEHARGSVSLPASLEGAEAPSWPVDESVREPVDLEACYARALTLGLDYGPAFRGLERAWIAQPDEAGTVELHAELRLPADAGASEGHAFHPALLDALTHLLLTQLDDDSEVALLPFAYRGATLHRPAGEQLRVRAELHRPTTDATPRLRFWAWTPEGELVATLDALELRPASAEQLRDRRPLQHAHALRWEPATVESADAGLPGRRFGLLGDAEALADALTTLGAEVVSAPSLGALLERNEAAAFDQLLRVWPTPGPEVLDAALPARVDAALGAAVAELQAWLATPQLRDVPLTWVTHGASTAALARADHSGAELVHAALTGLVRTAHSEHPRRALRLLDLGPGAALEPATFARMFGARERELALVDGELLTPRLRPLPVAPAESATPLEGATFISGGTSGLGAALAEHLVRERGVRHLILASRRGPESPDVDALTERLRELGAESVRVLACDVGEREAVAKALETATRERPLASVVHVAGVLADAPIEGLDAETIARVTRPKVAGAWHLHQLSLELEPQPREFVCFSGAAGMLGGPGQGNYAAANGFLDALAHHRASQGLPALSLAWGLWETGGLLSHLGEADRQRLRKGGLRPIGVREGMALYDAALAQAGALPVVAPIKFDLAKLSQRPKLPALARALVPQSLRQGERTRAKLRFDSSGEALRSELLQLVAAEIAKVLRSSAAIAPDRPLREVGLDSLMAVELRNALQDATDLELPSTLLFDYPTQHALVAAMAEQLEARTTPSLAVPLAVAQAASTLASEEEDPVVIVAMSCRYPGGVADPEGLWRLLDNGVDAIGEFPDDRGWPRDLYHPDPRAPGKSISREGGFIYDSAHFDAGFFGISPREAEAIDPQQRLLLEGSWEALERAQIPPDSLTGSSTGVFVGVMYSDYAGRMFNDLERLEGYLGIGSSASVASGRIAYSLGLTGPAVTVDTACSSSLVALHLARQALLAGECELALAGGVALMATPALFVEFSRQQAMAPDGRCKSFAAQADGAAWSEGMGMLVVERMSSARAKGHPILAVVRSTAVNQDGRSQGLTAPNGPSQRRLLETALRQARLRPTDIDAIEAHGTGTRLGDPIEAQSILAVYGDARPAERPLWLGSIKSNIGHAQSAAAVGGVIKVLLSLEHERLPKTLHVDAPTPHVDWSSGAVSLLTEAQPWPRSERVRRAGVSSFGISGTNAHVILEEPPAPPAPEASSTETATDFAFPPPPLLLSAKSEEGLRAQAGRLAAHLRGAPEPVDARALAAALVRSRSAFEFGAAVSQLPNPERPEDLAEARILELETLARTGASPRSVRGRRLPRARVAFVFPGQGAQWPAMAQELLRTCAPFRAELEACAAALEPHVEWSLLDVLEQRPGAVSLDRVDVVQPTLFAMMAGLAATWRALGVEPEVVVGHSQGEIGAAYCAGVLSLEDAAMLVARRSQLIRALSGSGGMAAVQLSREELDERSRRIDPSGEELAIAVDNGGTSMVVSGTLGAVDALLAELEADGVFARKVKVDYASHCAQVEPIQAQMLEACATIQPRVGHTPMMSTVDLRLVEGPELDGSYWFRNLRQRVRFGEAVAQLLDSGFSTFVEVSPHPLMGVPLAGAFEARDAGDETLFLPTLRRDQGGLEVLDGRLAELALAGAPIDWSRHFEASGEGPQLPLPTYAFQRRRFWIDRPTRTADAGPAKATDDAAPAADNPLATLAAAALEDGDLDALADELDLDQIERVMLAKLAPKLGRWHARGAQQRLAATWRHRVEWARVNPSVRGAAASPRWCLVHLPDPETGQPDPSTAALFEALRRAGQEPTLLRCEPGWTREDYRRALAEGLGLDAGRGARALPVDALLSTLALAEGEPTDGRPPSLETLERTTALLQGLIDLDAEALVPTLPRLWVLTRGAAGPHDLRAPEQAMLWGLGAVAGVEHVSLWGGCLDLPPALTDALDDPHALASALSLALASDESQLALRGGQVQAKRLVACPDHERTGAQPAWSGTALITGGTGAIGGHTARWLAREGIQRLVLTSRRGPWAPGAAELEAELVALGPSVELVACDITDPEALGALLDRLRREGPPLRAVFHSAGLVDDELIARLDPEQLRGPSLPKVGPAWQLHAATRDLELDAFVLYSSAAGTLAQIGQANYAAANAYLDALCQLRREAGLPGLSMAWGLWAGPSMATSVRAQLESQGVSAMEPAPAIAGLRRAVALGDTHVVLGAFDWAKVRFGGRGQLLAILQSEGVEAEEAAADSSFDLDALPRGERGPAIQAFVLDAVARTLRLSPEEADPKRSLTALGLDSMTSVELRDELRERGAFEVRLADLLRGVSVAELSQQLLAAYEGELDGDEAPEAPASPWLWCPMPRPDATRRLICFPYGGGGPSVFRGWDEALGPDCELHVVHLPGRGARTGEAIPMTIEDYVAPIVEAILALPPRPTACLGHCLGAMFMVEVAAVLEHEHGFVLEHAFASAAPPPDHYFPSTAVFDHSDETVLGTLLAIGFTGTQALVDDPELRTLVLPAVRGDFEFAAHYSAQDHQLSPISAPLTVLTGLHDWFAAPQPMPRWAELTRGHCELHLLEDGHHYFIESHREHVQALVLDTLEGRPRQRGPFEAVPMDRWTMRTRPRRGSSVELHMARRKPNWSWTWRRRAHAVGGAARILVLLPGLFDTPCPVSEVEALDPDVAVLALEGLDLGGQALENGVALLAAELVQPQGALGSLILAGHGFGAIVAFELARRLGGGIQSLVAINSAPPHESFQSHTHHAGDAFLTQLMHLAGRPDSAGEMNFARVKRNLITAARYTHDLRAYASREEQDALPPIRAFCAEHDFLSSRHLVQRWSALGEDVELVYTTGDHFTPVPARDLVP